MQIVGDCNSVLSLRSLVVVIMSNVGERERINQQWSIGHVITSTAKRATPSGFKNQSRNMQMSISNLQRVFRCTKDQIS